jgi:hypothetical protein
MYSSGRSARNTNGLGVVDALLANVGFAVTLLSPQPSRTSIKYFTGDAKRVKFQGKFG